MKRKPLSLILAVLAAMFLLYSADNTGSQLRDYVCRINVHLLPNMDNSLRDIATGLWKLSNDDSIHQVAEQLNAIRMGSSGSGFVYVDKSGANYIITNYHVVAEASNFSVTFEKANGQTTRYRNLSVFSVDRENDLAMLAFSSDNKTPFKKGLLFYSKSPSEQAEVWAAGFPRMGGIPQWNPTKGNISNLKGEVKISDTSSARKGPYYIHSAQVNPGNSGGPLLIADSRSPAKYSVVGVNVMKFTDSDGGNLAIPLDKVQFFVLSSIEKSKRDNKQILNQQIDEFVRVLNNKDLNKTKMNDDKELFSPFLSTTMVDSNIVGGLTSFTQEFGGEVVSLLLLIDPINTMFYTTAYTTIIKPLMRMGTIKIESVYLEENNFGGYTVLFLINGYIHRTEWIKEYGTYRLTYFSQDDGKLNHLQIYASYFPLGKTVHYSFISTSDMAWYRIEITKAGTLRAETTSNMATQITLFDSGMHEITRGDSGSGRNSNALVTQKVNVGTYYLEVKQPNQRTARTGNYDLTVRIE
ncbi:MAG: serine protease [Spirochaetaceae bacterium]|nr:serine protease [Spirochaetaceae bacterium]